MSETLDQPQGRFDYEVLQTLSPEIIERIKSEGLVIAIITVPTEDLGLGGVGSTYVSEAISSFLNIPIIPSGEIAREIAASQGYEGEENFLIWRQMIEAASPELAQQTENDIDQLTDNKIKSQLGPNKTVCVDSKIYPLKNGGHPPTLVIGVTAFDAVASERLYQRMIENKEIFPIADKLDRAIYILTRIQDLRANRYTTEVALREKVGDFCYTRQCVFDTCHVLIHNNIQMTPDQQQQAISALINDLSVQLPILLNPSQRFTA